MAAHKLHGRTKLYGFEISIENRKGSVRRWYDEHGKEKGQTKMHFDYGYIRGTKGTDGDHVDVYIGPSPESDRVFLVDQMKKPPGDIVKDGKAWKQFDEQKVMLAFADADAAKAAYLRQYDDPRFFGGMKEMSVDDFKSKALAHENHGKKLAAMKRADRLYAELNLARHASGMDIVLPKLSAELLGDASPGITALAVTPFSQATTTKQERKEADQEVKSAMRTVLSGGPKMNMKEYTAVNVKHLPDDPTFLIHNSLVKGFYEAGGEKGTWGDQAAYLKPHVGTKVHMYGRNKEASDRAGRISDRIDDVGIGLLAAPYAASAASHGLARSKNPKVKALGAAVEKSFGTNSAFGHSHGRELAGLAMVAPGVTHTLARGIDKATAKKTASGDMLQYFADHPEKLREKRERDKKAELEKIAQSLFPDYEYKTETEKLAIAALLGRLGGLASRAGKGVAAAGRATTAAVGRAAGAARTGLADAAVRSGDRLRGGFIAGERGVSQSMGERAARVSRLSKAQGAAAAPTATVPRPPVKMPQGPVAPGGVPTPIPGTTAIPVARGGKWNPTTARNVALAGGGAALGLGAYGGYKAIQTAGNLVSNHHEVPLAPPGYSGAGRVF